MDFLKLKKFKKLHILNVDNVLEGRDNQVAREDSSPSTDHAPLKVDAKDVDGDIDDNEDDMITREVKRRLEEFRMRSSMSLIPEESCSEEDWSSRGTGEAEAEECRPWGDYKAFYDKYCEHMLFYDKIISQKLRESVSCGRSVSLPRSASKKLIMSLRSFSFKKPDESHDQGCLQQSHKLQDGPYQELEAAYVAQVCLTWEALHSQHALLTNMISCKPNDNTCYSHAAQQFQHFQVLLERFTENEPFEHDDRVKIYAQARCSLPKLLQVPYFHGSQTNEGEEDLSASVHAIDLIRIIETSISTFWVFLKMDKRRGGDMNLVGGDHISSSLQLFQDSVDKKGIKLMELHRKSKGWKKKSGPRTPEELKLLFGLIDVKVVSRVLKMGRIREEQLLWCEEKMSKLAMIEGKLERDGSPVLFSNGK